jgi:hypothetical protein
MRGYILIGSVEQKSDFVSKFINDNKVSSYNTVRFASELKISDAREIKKSLSVAALDGANRLIVFESKLTTEAQNALLKLLEELPEDTSVIFTRDRELLPTIVSRCSIVKLGDGYLPSVNDEDMEIVLSLLNSRDTSGKLLAIEKFFSQEREDPFADLLLSVREAVIKEAPNQFELLKKLVKYYPLVSSNNLNPKMTAERLLLTNAF